MTTMARIAMTRAARLWAAVAAVCLTAACGGQQEYAYLADAPRNTAMQVENHYSSTIFAGDRLYVYVSSSTPEAVVPFNEETNKAVVNDGQRKVKVSAEVKGYEVAPDGSIQFPVLGSVPAAGLTYEGLARRIERLLVDRRYVKDPVVTVSLMNFHVTVIGEVQRPSVLTCVDTRLTIFEALARCGDITLGGKRHDVAVVRFGADSVAVERVDLTSKSVLGSPYYYLQQGDIVYVEPTDKKKRTAFGDDEWPHYISMGANALRMAYIIVYRYLYFKDNP